MSFFNAFEISASALAAERTRMNVVAENLANANSTRAAGGGPYRRKEVVLQQNESFGAALAGAMGGGRGPAGGVKVSAIVADASAPRMVHDPSHPDADARGYVAMPNIDPVIEMVDLITAQRSYEANVTAMQTAKAMFSKTLELLR